MGLRESRIERYRFISLKIQDLLQLYARSPKAGALLKTLGDRASGNVFLSGLSASSTPLLFASVAPALCGVVVFVLQDQDEAGYFYHDLTQALGTDNVLFFPSSYRRAVKYGQNDSANEVLRTEVLARLSALPSDSFTYIVTHPGALAELVVSRQTLGQKLLHLSEGQSVDLVETEHKLREFGFHQVDYVYERAVCCQRKHSRCFLLCL